LLKRELEYRNFEVFVPQIPEADKPRIYNWLPALSKLVINPNQNTYFVGHSMGCELITRYLETLDSGVVIGGAVFVAGFFKCLTVLDDNRKTKDITNHCLQSPIDLFKVKSHLKKSTAIFSDNDPFVPLENQNDFKSKLGSEIIIEEGKGHFSGSTGILELPAALQTIIEMSK